MFEATGWLWLLPLALYYGYHRLKTLGKVAVSMPPLQHEAAGTRTGWQIYGQVGAETLLIVLVLVALARPFRTTEQSTIKDDGLDIIFALDISSSMQAADFPPNRLEALKKLTSDFIRRSGSNRIGLLVFAKHIFSQSPLTSDHSILHYLVDGISYEMINHSTSGGTQIGDALVGAVDTLKRFKIKGRDQVIVLISDGESDGGVDPIVAARLVRERNIRFYAIGIGGDKEVEVYVHGKPFINWKNEILKTKLDDRQLKAITEAAGGRYFRAKNVNVLAAIFEELSRLEKTPLEIQTRQQKESVVPTMAIFIFVLFAAGLVFQSLFVRNPLR